MVYIDFSILIDNIGINAKIDYFNKLNNIHESSLSPHSHVVYEVYFIEEGEMSVRFEDEIVRLKQHDILIIPPERIHRVEYHSDALKRFNLRFVFTDNSPPGVDASFFLYRPDECIKDEIYQCIKRLHENLPNINDKLALFRTKSYLGTILSYVIEVIIPEKKQYIPSDSPINEHKNRLTQCVQIDKFFGENFSRSITLDELAEFMHYSKTHVNRLLKNHWNMSFVEKLAQTRLHVAKQFLTESTMTIAEIAERCGYSSLRGFEIFFSKQTGMRPYEYRKNHISSI